MTIKMKISKSGYDAITETDPDNLVFSSDYNTLKYYDSGTEDVVVDGSNVEESVTHDLGYVPFFITYVKEPATGRISMTPIVILSPGGDYTYVESYCTDDKLYFTIHTNSATATFTYYYKIFRNDTEIGV